MRLNLHTAAMLASLLFALGLTGCDSEPDLGDRMENAAEGAGENIEDTAENVGEEVEDTAERVEDKVD